MVISLWRIVPVMVSLSPSGLWWCKMARSLAIAKKTRDDEDAITTTPPLPHLRKLSVGHLGRPVSSGSTHFQSWPRAIGGREGTVQSHSPSIRPGDLKSKDLGDALDGLGCRVE